MTLCKWEKGPGPIPAWVAGVVSTLAEGQRRQGARLPAFREALKTLEAKGLVEARAKVGTRVLPQSRWNLFDRQVLGLVDESEAA